MALLVLALAGCTALRLVYKQADELLYWWADGYADFTDAQAPRVRAAIGEWFAWHRRSQLPVYATRLAQMQSQVQADTTPAAVCALRDEVQGWFDVAFEQGLPSLAALAPTLEADQLKSIRKRFDKLNRDYRHDFVQPDAAGRREALLKRTLERAERLYGRFDRAQRERIAQLIAASPFDAETSMELRLSRQQDVLQTLRGLHGAAPAQAQAALSALARRVEHPPKEAERRYQQALAEFNCGLTAQIHNLSTPEQRRAARERLHGWELDLKALAGPGNG
ncbi:DUF6279 family lipoprotein [Azohydromonas caseinilytica]|uniref:Lipoprotein n=1 Tax=Azohydromonas caseinilytica TaxID=2728836 RepID=A0A848F3J9_9BURK|nr:DUF6279 family lipoprotein [Azohydromonas caseinilytica]NML13638.1 hypothetical protein [Azohydromonas caseinilytica]